jgi:hypothetical protein
MGTMALNRKGGNMKLCFKCQVAKPFTDFYKHSGMSDGYLNKCKQCTKTDSRQYRESNLEKVRLYDRQRAKLAHRLELSTKLAKIWRGEDKRRTAAHNAVIRAIKGNKLSPEPCKVCGNEEVVAHHEDYDKPLDVVWLCYSCHAKHHKGKK